MAFWQAFGIILGSVLTGILLGLAVIYVISRIQKRPMFLPRKSTLTPAQKLIAETINAPAKASSNSTPVRWDNLGELFKEPEEIDGVSNKVEVDKVQSQRPKSISSIKPETKPIMKTAASIPVENKKLELLQKRKRAETFSQQRPQKPIISKKAGIQPTTADTTIMPAENKREELLKIPEGVNVSKEKERLRKTTVYKELESNLAIAMSPWSDKMIPFQTVIWDSDSSKAEVLLASYYEELAQAYIDIHLANSITWLSNEMGHRSTELDESYKQLCVKIAERLNRILG